MNKETSPMSGKGTLDNLIQGCNRHGLFQATTDGLDPHIKTYCGASCVRIGDLVFRADSHSTGCGVNVWVVDGAEALMVRNTTYWYSSRHTFNEPHNVYGPWDKAIGEAMAMMEREVQAAEQKQLARKEEEARNAEVKKLSIQERFAAKFQ